MAENDIENCHNSEVNIKPRIDMRFGSEEEAYQFYNRYGGIAGFSVRKECVHRDKDDKTIIKYRRFLCSKAGLRGVDKRDKFVRKPRAETRTNCLAKMCISRTLSGDYICREFVEDHNHELHTPSTRHFMRSQRSVTDFQGFEIDMADQAGIRPKAVFDYMGIRAGGNQNIGYTQVDLKNYLRTKRQSSMQYGEAGALNDYFATQQKLNPSFVHRYQYDNEEMVTNIFWADPRMLIDYALFGDVVVFDTTFCTNKENRPLGVFSGFNHHRGATIFGAALLYDETIDSFKWLFKTFLEVHGGNKPRTIFTDQDAAMSNAIAEVMPDTWHGLCIWHLMQNAIKNLAPLIKVDRSILNDFKRCMYDIEDEEEFEEAWQQMLFDHKIEDNLWLNRTYELKKKWAKCYMKQTFTAGVRSTQLSKSMNSDLKDYLKKNLNLQRFFTQFERVVADKRSNELKAEFDAKNTRPNMVGFRSPILRHAAKVYTPYIYSEFQEQYSWITSCLVEKCDDMDDIVNYTIRKFDEDGGVMEQEYEVMYIRSGPFIACSCRLFETFGIICSHALKILDVLSFNHIPDSCILPRWTRAVRSTVVEDTTGSKIVDDANYDCTEGFRMICPQFVKLSAQACTSAAGRTLAQKIADTFRLQLAAMHNESPPSVDSIHNQQGNTDLILKRKEKHRGSSKRHKSWVAPTGKRTRKGVSRSGKSSTDLREGQQQSQHVTVPDDMQGYNDTSNYTDFSELLMELHSAQGSTHIPNLSTHHYSGEHYPSQFHTSQVNQSQGEYVQGTRGHADPSLYVPDFLSQVQGSEHTVSGNPRC